MEVLRRLTERGLVYQMTDEERMAEVLGGERLSFYIGFDPTAPSLHLGHLVPLMAAGYLRRAGHRPIIVIGGGTALVGDPSGRSAERTLESKGQIGEWADSVADQMEGFLDLGEEYEKPLMLDNSDWLTELGYIDFLRDYGRHFSVNRMLSVESVKSRLQTGLSFLEFNYMLLQAYDYLHLFRNHQCTLQMGGADQWGNIVAGIDLIRRVEGGEAFGLTCPLVTTSTGEKMSKSMPGGAVWLDPGMTSPYDYYQFWINVDDRDVVYFLKLYTFVPTEEIDERYARLKGREMREAKERLAWEATAIAHGERRADEAREASRALFDGAGAREHVPSLSLPLSRLTEGVNCLDLFVETGLCSSRAEVRRLAKQGGLYLNEQRVENPLENLREAQLDRDGNLRLRAGKKRYYVVSFRNG
ncbi:tyrosine--tRNA ligase [Candidatus Fermentibacteria bacterium]|nr:tyrosine--tRNA ligase [Candidatus Fermentibacteria bacterium]